MLRSIPSYSLTHAVVRKALFLSCFFVVWSIAGVSVSLAGEVILIGTILMNPESYYLHVVTLEGTVRNIKSASLPLSGPCNDVGGVFYNPFTFTLEDETGSIVVARPQICGPPGLLKVPEVTEGEKVIIEAEISGPTQDFQYRKDFPDELPMTYAVVKTVRRP